MTRYTVTLDLNLNPLEEGVLLLRAIQNGRTPQEELVSIITQQLDTLLKLEGLVTDEQERQPIRPAKSD